MAKVLAEEEGRGRVDLQALTLSDAEPFADLGVHARTAGGSRRRYVLDIHRAALSCSHFLYDFLGMARAHCRLPGLRRPFLVWMLGVEIWEHARADRVRWARRADTLLACSRYTVEHAAQLHGGFDRAQVCWPGTETDDPPAMTSSSDGPPTVLIVGRLEPGRDKGHRALIDCWARVTDACSGAVLRIAGAGPDEKALREHAQASASAGQIVFEGFVSAQKLERLYTEATVFAMPSRGEGFGLVYIEAMRHALPVVASLHDAAPEIVVDEETGFTVDMGRDEALPARLIDLLRDQERAAAMGKAGQDRWRRHFTYRAFRERFLGLLHEFLHADRA